MSDTGAKQVEHVEEKFKVLGRKGNYVLVEPEDGDIQNISTKDFQTVLKTLEGIYQGLCVKTTTKRRNTLLLIHNQYITRMH